MLRIIYTLARSSPATGQTHEYKALINLWPGAAGGGGGERGENGEDGGEEGNKENVSMPKKCVSSVVSGSVICDLSSDCQCSESVDAEEMCLPCCQSFCHLCHRLVDKISVQEGGEALEKELLCPGLRKTFF